MKIAVKSFGYDIVDKKNYEGAWFDGDINPRPIYLYVNSEDVWVEVLWQDGWSQDIQDKIDIRFKLPNYIYHVKEIEEILDYLKDDIVKLRESYSFNNYSNCGSWDFDLESYFQNKIDTMPFEPSLEFVDEEELEEVED